MHVFRYLVLPHYKWTFSSYFASLIEEGKRPDEREVLLLLIQLCNALVHLQRHHVVHCDFKVMAACMAVCLARYLAPTHSDTPLSGGQPVPHHRWLGQAW